MKYIRQQINEAIENNGGNITTKLIKKYVLQKWPQTNPRTIDAQIQIMTVNHDSRTSFLMNKKPRVTGIDSKYDKLFKTGPGVFEKYNPEKHGLWEIYQTDDSQYKIRLFSEDSITTYSPNDIIWFKSVTNDQLGKAYLDLSQDIFVLNFPLRHRTNMLSPKKNDLILLYQKVNGRPSFTHLVTPIDENEFDENIRSNYRYGRKVRIIAKTGVDNAIPVPSTLWSKIRLSGVVNGNACRIDHISGVKDLEALLTDTWNRFKEFCTPDQKENFEKIATILAELDREEISEKEGGLKMVSHLARERNRKIVSRKKIEALKNGRLFCEVCSFSFIKKFGSEFIECHHIHPISDGGERKTELKDLACVCPNCHRMLHKKFDGKYLSIKELQKRLKQFKGKKADK